MDVRIWRRPETVRHQETTVPYRGESVMVWGCFSFDYKLDLVTIQIKLNIDRYIQEVFNPVLLPHFDNQPPATPPVFVDVMLGHIAHELFTDVICIG